MGAGNMASALLKPLKKELLSFNLFFYTPSIKRAKSLASELDQVALEGEEDPNWKVDFDGLFLTHKPQQLQQVGEFLKKKLKSEPNYIISIIAGKSVSDIQANLYSIPVLRLMPNTPCLVGKGIISEFASFNFENKLKNTFHYLFSCYSKVVTFLDEGTFDKATPILGSGPGVLFEFANIFYHELLMLGLSQDLSKSLVSELFKGSFDLATASEKSFVDQRDAVTSKGGITERMLEVLKEKNISAIIKEAIDEGRLRGELL